MNPQVIEAQPPKLNPPLAVGIPGDLVFDDNPLDPLLYGTEPIAPTPASVLELWEQGLDRSAACARAMVAVLVQCPDGISKVRDLDAAEQCLRQAVESQTEICGSGLAACWSALGQILELRNQNDEAEDCYRHALRLQEDSSDCRPDLIEAIRARLIQVLEKSNRPDEAKPFRNRIKADRLRDRNDEASFGQLRSVALDMFLAGQYADAESAYRHLVSKRFELASTHCHLARVFLMTDREADARREVEQARAVQPVPPDYLLARIQFLRTVLQMLAGEEWTTCLVEFKDALAKPGAHADWTMQRVLDHLRSRLRPELFDLPTTMLAAVCQKSKLLELEGNPLWRKICGGKEAGVPMPSQDPSMASRDLN